MADKIGTDEYGEILIYQTDDGQTNIEVKIEDDTVWLTQQQLTELYQCSKANRSEHIKHIFEEGELDKDSVVRCSAIHAFSFFIAGILSGFLAPVPWIAADNPSSSVLGNITNKSCGTGKSTCCCL